MAPAPKARAQKINGTDVPIVHMPEDQLIDISEDQGAPLTKKKLQDDTRSESPAKLGSSPKTTFLRRTSSGMEGNHVAVRANMNDMREHLKHLGPSNLASRPKTTRYNTVKIKANVTGRSESRTDSSIVHDTVPEEQYHDEVDHAPQGGEGEGLLKSAGKEASDGVHAVQQGYGSFGPNSPSKLSHTDNAIDGPNDENTPLIPTRSASPDKAVTRIKSHDSQKSSDTLGSMHSVSSKKQRKRNPARSGSITEHTIEAGGIRKVVLETTSSTDDDNSGGQNGNTVAKPPGTASSDHSDAQGESQTDHTEQGGEQVKKKRKRTRRKKAKAAGDEASNAGSSAQ